MKREFDVNITEPIKKISDYIKKHFPTRCWHIEVTFWDDKDYRIEAVSNYGKRKDSICYRRADNEYFYVKELETGEIQNPCNLSTYDELEHKKLDL
jgi:hypothetical protein